MLNKNGKHNSYEINTWFINNIVYILKIYRTKNNGYPIRFHKEYYEQNKNELNDVDEFVFTNTDCENQNKYVKDKHQEMINYSINKWNNIVDEMIMLFSDAKCDSLALKTEYQKECAHKGLQLFTEYFEDLWW